MAPLKRKSSVLKDAKLPNSKTAPEAGHARKKSRTFTSLPPEKDAGLHAATKSAPPPIHKTPITSSLIRGEEAAFPRGGASVLTPLEHKQIKADATRDVLFEQSQPKASRNRPAEDDDDDGDAAESRPTSVKHKTKSRSKSKKETVPKAEEPSVRIEGLGYRRLVPGSLILGQVVEINRHDVALALPNNLTGYIPLTAVSDEVNERLERLLAQDDSDLDDQEGDDAGSTRDDDLDLNTLFTLGQFFRARVTSTTDEASATGPVTVPAKRRIELSVNPRLVNEGLSRSELIVNNTVQASVVSVEDHGLVMNVGLGDASLRGFMSSKQTGRSSSHPPLEPGAVVLCMVSGQSANGNTVKLSADPLKMGHLKKAAFLSTAPTIDAFLPGTAVEFLVAEVTSTGLAGKVMGLLDVTADLVHSGACASAKALTKRFAVGQKVKGRIVCTFPTVEPKKLGLSLLHHLLALSPLTVPRDGQSHPPVDVLPLSSTMEQAKVVKVVPGFGLFLDTGIQGVPAFVHISKIADKKVDTLAETTGPYKVGSIQTARIYGYNPMDATYLASMQERVLQQPFLRLEDVEVGQVVKGTVEKLMLNADGVGGLLVNLADGITGLVPDMHMADVALSHPERKFREGMTVTTRVLSTDPEKRQLRLTLKKSLVHSDAPIFTSYDEVMPNAQSPGTLVKILPSGAVVQFYASVRAFLPVSEMSEAYIQDPVQHFRLGQVVTVHVLSVDARAQKMTVSCRDLTALGQQQMAELKALKIGSVVSGKVSEKSADDLTLELVGSSLKATMVIGHLTDGSEQKNASAHKRVRVGQTLNDLVVLQKKEAKRLIILSGKPSLVADAQAGRLVTSFEDITEGSIVHGFVSNVTPTDVFVRFAADLTSILPGRNLPEESRHLPDFGLRRNQSITAAVESLDHSQQRFVLSMTDEVTASSSKTGSTEAIINPVDPSVTSPEQWSLGQLTKARIVSIKATQINVKLADNVQGRIDVSQVFDSWDEIKDRKHPLRRFHTHDVLLVRILGLHDSRNHRFLPITHRGAKVPVFELSAKPSELTSFNPDYLTLNKVAVGSTWVAFINNIAQDYLWVNLSPNVRGRLRHLDVSDDVSLLQDMEKNFPVGSALKVHVTHVDVASHRLDLSARSMTSSTTGFASLAKGMVIPGRVTKVTERSIIVQLSETTSGHVGLTDLADDYSKANPTGYRKNEIVRVCVTELDVSNQKMWLSTRPSRVLNSSFPVTDPEILAIDQLKVNDVVRGFIKNVADTGVFVSLGPQVTAYVRVSDLSDSFIKDWKSGFEEGQLVKGKITAVDSLLNHAQMSLKVSVIDKDYVPPTTFDDISVGQVVTGKVRKVEAFGVFIVVDHSANVSGLCHRSEIADQRVGDITKLYEEGDVVKAKVLKVEPEKRRISFGLKASYFVDGNEAIDESDDSEDGMDGVMLGDADEEFEGEEVEGEDRDEGVEGGGVAVEEPTGMTKPRNGLRATGFDWTGSVLDQDGTGLESEMDDDETNAPKRKKRRRAEIKVDQTGELDAEGPRSSEDFERLLLGQPDSSSLWLQYMASYLQLSEVGQARETAERALQTINVREETEKLNVWVGLLNLENTYGSDDTVEDVFKRACQYNDAQEVHERLASIYIQSGKQEQAKSLFDAMVKKFSQSPSIWYNAATFHMQTLSSPGTARSLLPRALQALPPHTHVATTTKFASLEFHSASGDAERGRTLFEGVLSNFPKRWDLWNVLLDLEMSKTGRTDQKGDREGGEGQDEGGRDERIRNLFARIVALPGLKPKPARAFFKRWREFEVRLPSSTGRVQEVENRAATWVRERSGGTEGDGNA
ncbi:MAG: rRNA biogenesis protein rrp5 [Thelocarpon superellum]|nr:MAG: rRNA biogenesis protein rrp5 [Thelocarpon superellum]